MQRGYLWMLSAALAAGSALGGCSGSKDGAEKGAEAKGQKATPIGTPRPAFEGEAPKGAFVADDAEVGRYGGHLAIATAGDPKGFNPLIANETSTTDILFGPVFQSCWDFNRATQEEEPGLCEKYTRSPDGLTYTFTLREGLRWSDGTPLTADDFEFSYEVITDPNVPNSLKDLFRQGDTEDGKPRFPIFEKVDDRTFKFTLFEKNVLFHAAVGSIYAVPKAKWQKAYEAGEFNKAMSLQTPTADLVSSGPYVIDKFETGERVALKRNPHYWKVDRDGHRLPYMDRVTFIIVADFNTEMLKFRQGETHLLEVRPEHYEALKRKEAEGGYTIFDLGPSFNTNYLMFNLDDGVDKDGNPYVPPVKAKWFQNVQFRKAVSHAIDRDGLVRTVMSGRGEPLWAFTSPGNKKWYPEGKVTKYPYDLEASRRLLSEAGFVYKDDTLYDAEGNAVEFTAITNSENAVRIGMLNVIKDDLKKLGVTMHIRPVPFNDLVTSLRDARNFEAVLLGWGTGIPPDPAQSKNILLSSGRSHAWHPEQEKPATEWEARMDELVRLNSAVYEHAERRKYSDELYAIFADKLPQIMLVVGTDAVAARNDIGNLKPSPLRPKAYWNIETLYFKSPKD